MIAAHIVMESTRSLSPHWGWRLWSKTTSAWVSDLNTLRIQNIHTEAGDVQVQFGAMILTLY